MKTWFTEHFELFVWAWIALALGVFGLFENQPQQFQFPEGYSVKIAQL